jgi:polyhydroxyalkanoate synthesis regulator phasin
MREELASIAAQGRLWATSRAEYMISVLDQLDRGAIDQEQATAWMWDVLRQLNEQADDEALRSRVEGMARHLGQLNI